MQLNQAEFNQLQSSLLSHMARSLYIFYLQPQARQQNQVSINLPYLASKLTSQSSFSPSSPSLKDVAHALNELEQHNLIARSHPEQNWQNTQISFPLFEASLKLVPQRPFAINSEWLPGPNFRYAALNAGLIDYQYTTEELTEFINYWSERHDLRTQSGWERLFIRRLIKIHTATVCTPRNYLRPRYDNFALCEENINTIPATVCTHYDQKQKFLPPYHSHNDFALLSHKPKAINTQQQTLSSYPFHSEFKKNLKSSDSELTTPTSLPPSAPQISTLPAVSSVPDTSLCHISSQDSTAYAAPRLPTTMDDLERSTEPWLSNYEPSANMAFSPNPSEDKLIEDPLHKRIQTTSFREKRPTLTAIYTGKEDYTLTAPGYTDPQNYENTQNKIIGRIPISTAKGYTPPEVLYTRAQNLNYTGRLIEQDVQQGPFATIDNAHNAPKLQLSEYGFTPLEFPPAQQTEQNKKTKPLPNIKPKL